MKRILFSICAALAAWNCSGENINELPILGSEDYDYGNNQNQSSSSTDSYVGKGNDIGNYRTVQIGSQRWMAENLDYNVSGSKCYNNQDSYCSQYGRLYDWATAMALPSSCNSSYCASQVSARHQGICPNGWHIPSDDEWSALIDYAGGSSTAGTKLKAQDGWESYSGVPRGQDTYGFAALPGGGGYSDGSFGNAGYGGRWWSSSENDALNAYYRSMGYDLEGAYWFSYDKSYFFSIRCLQDGSGTQVVTSSSSQANGSSGSRSYCDKVNVGSYCDNNPYDPYCYDCDNNPYLPSCYGICDMGYCLWGGTNCVKIAYDPDGVYGDPTFDCAEALAQCEIYGQRFNDATCGCR